MTELNIYKEYKIVGFDGYNKYDLLDYESFKALALFGHNPPMSLNELHSRSFDEKKYTKEIVSVFFNELFLEAECGKLLTMHENYFGCVKRKENAKGYIVNILELGSNE